MEKVFAKQPIVDSDENIVAYELLYRNPKTLQADFSSAFQATLKIVDVLMELLQIQDPPYYFINADKVFLFSHQIELLTPNRIIIEVLEDVELDERVISRIEYLRKLGFKVALDDMKERKSGVQYFDIVKFDMPQIKNLENMITSIPTHVKMLAEKVEEKRDFEKLKEFGFELFQGYFFAKPMLKRKKRIDPLKKVVIDILNRFDKLDMKGLVKVIKSEHALALKFIQYVNAAHFYRKEPITTVQSALSYIGLKNFKKWLYLQLYNSTNKYSPLFNTIQSRVYMMEELARYYKLDEDMAYFTGALSLMDVLLGVSLDEVLRIVKVDEKIKDAIKQRSGKYGELLQIIEYIEHEKYDKISLDTTFINKLVIGSMKKSYFF